MLWWVLGSIGVLLVLGMVLILREIMADSANARDRDYERKLDA